MCFHPVTVVIPDRPPDHSGSQSHGRVNGFSINPLCDHRGCGPTIERTAATTNRTPNPKQVNEPRRIVRFRRSTAFSSHAGITLNASIRRDPHHPRTIRPRPTMPKSTAPKMARLPPGQVRPDPTTRGANSVVRLCQRERFRRIGVPVHRHTIASTRSGHADAGWYRRSNASPCAALGPRPATGPVGSRPRQDRAVSPGAGRSRWYASPARAPCPASATPPPPGWPRPACAGCASRAT